MLVHKSRIWLILFDLYLRHFTKREAQERIKQRYLYEEADLNSTVFFCLSYNFNTYINFLNISPVIHKLIWSHKINLAASISRLRIKNGALKLAHLLPIHLQDDKVAIAAANPIVTGWINPFKTR